MNHIDLTSTEMGFLWASYQTQSLNEKVLTYFNRIIEDNDIKEVSNYALDLCRKDLSVLSDIFKKDNFPTPIGFTQDDITADAERLYTDAFMLYFLWFIGKTYLNFNSVACNTVARDDVFKFYERCTKDSLQLLNMARIGLLSKGLWIRAPFIPKPKQNDFVHKQSYIEGLLKGNRPLTGLEINNAFYNIITNSIGMSLITSFAQVCKNDEIRKYFVRGKEISNKHVEVLSAMLKEDGLPAPSAWNLGITSSTQPPFSDKLMLTTIANLNGQGLSNYGMALSTSLRKDIGIAFGRLSTEIAQYAEDGTNLQIKYGWLEQPPQAPDRNRLQNE